MELKLKRGTVITATQEDGSFWEIDDTVIFTDTKESGLQTYNNEGKKLYFPKNHDLSGCGFPEDMFETNMEQMTKIEALEYLVKNEIHTSEWKGTAMYLKCKEVITSSKTFFTKDELDEMLKEVENS